jgi:hypothetical protein
LHLPTGWNLLPVQLQVGMKVKGKRLTVIFVGRFELDSVFYSGKPGRGFQFYL